MTFDYYYSITVLLNHIKVKVIHGVKNIAEDGSGSKKDQWAYLLLKTCLKGFIKFTQRRHCEKQPAANYTGKTWK